MCFDFFWGGVGFTGSEDCLICILCFWKPQLGRSLFEVYRTMMLASRVLGL